MELSRQAFVSKLRVSNLETPHVASGTQFDTESRRLGLQFLKVGSLGKVNLSVQEYYDWTLPKIHFLVLAP